MHRLLIKLKASNIHLSLNHDDLIIEYNDILTQTNTLEEILKEIRNNKKELINYLKNNIFNEFDYKPIPQVTSQSSYSLSSSQRRLWVLSQFEESSITYNISKVYVFEGNFDRELLEQSFTTLIARHEILRTIFKENEQGEIKQFIKSKEESVFTIGYKDLRKEKKKEKQIRELVQEEITKPFDLEAGPLIRAGLYQVEDTKWIFTYVMHHIISDGWSMGILVKELLSLFNVYIQGEENSLLPLRIQYKDYAAWQQEQLNEEKLKVHQDYWLKQFEGELPVLELPIDKVRPVVKTYNGGIINKNLSSKLSKGIKNISQEQGGTLFMGLLAAVNTLLYHYTNQSDIIIGSPVAGREHAELEDQIGFYVNTLVLRARFKGSDSYKNLLSAIRDVTLGAYEHQVYPFDELVDNLHLNRDTSRNAMFDVMVVLQNAEIGIRKEQNLKGIKVSGYEADHHMASKFDLTFTFMEQDDGLYLGIEYNTDLFYEESVKRISNHFEQLLESIVVQPEISINKLEYISKAEKQKLLIGFNDTAVDYPKEKTLVNIFEEQVAKTPDNIALVFQETELTYTELNEKSNQLADYLRKSYKIKADDLIGIKLERSEWMIISILGVLKSGGAYVPIDPEYPQERVDYMVEDSKCRLVIDQEELAKFKKAEKDFSKKNLKSINKSGDLAYVIYTSGSTGKPKGVMVENRTLINLCFWHKIKFSLTEEDHASLYAGVSFDASVWEIFPYIITGASLYVIPKDIRLVVNELSSYYELNKITISFLPTQIGENFLKVENQSLRYLLIGGGKLNSFAKKKYRIINNYGPTENTVVGTSYEVNKNYSNIPIGRPINNTQIYILGKENQLLPIGVIGEICIGGDGLARGYLNKAELTAEKFVDNPFKEGGRMYKTGDLGRWLEDGNIEFIGRKDDQIKIRGYRIELGEIESIIQSHKEIESAIVIAKIDNSGEKELVAYIVSKEEQNASELREYLKNTLPDYMIPGHYVQLEKLPLTPNGKVDKKALPDPEGLEMKTGVEYVASRNWIEEKLVKIWEEILGREKIGVRDNFFELGGHSLKATRLVSRIYKDLEVKLGLKDLFTTPTLEGQAHLIEQAGKSAYAGIHPVPYKKYYDLSSSQRRLWVLSQFEESSVAYNMPGVYEFEGELDRSALEDSFKSIIERHEILRTVFKEDEQKEVKQFIKTKEKFEFNIGYKDLRKEKNKEGQVKEFVKQEVTSPFDLSTGPLVRAGLYQVENNKWVFSYVMHHIISDGWSMGILIKELLSLYNTYIKGEVNPLLPLRIQYKDYSAWQQEQLSGENIQEHKTYWLKQFTGELPVLELAADKVRPAVKTYNGSVISKQLNSKVSKGIKRISQEQGGTLFMGLLSAVNTLLYRYTNQEDIIIGSPIAGREDTDLENQIGLYLNTLALRTQLKGENSFIELLHHTKEVTLGAYEHQAYPFDELVDKLHLHRDMSRSALFDVMVVLQNADIGMAGEQDLQNIKVSGYESEQHVVSKFDLTFSFMEKDDELYLGIEYNTDLFYEESIKRLSNHFEQLLESIAVQPEISIDKLEYISSIEKQKLVGEFNDTELSYPQEKTLVDLFEEQVKKTPKNIALVFEEKELSYKELNERSNQLADYLRKSYDIKADDLVGINLERSELMIISILGVLKSGGAYVPIDPEYPQERIDYMVEDSKCKVLIDEGELAKFKKAEKDYSKKNLKSINKFSDLAYVIYTSGTTGKPKGTLIEHKNVVRLFKTDKPLFDFNSSDVWTMFHSYCFDFSVWEMYGALLHGGKLIIIPSITTKDPKAYIDLLRKERVTILNQTPSSFYNIIKSELEKEEADLQLRYVIFGGEALSPGKLEDWRKRYPTTKLINMYGITETTVHVTYKEITEEEIEKNISNIGKPIPTLSCYVLDQHQNLLPIGVPGELYIGGAGVSRGYLNREDLTQQKFIVNPFKEEEILYRSGDKAKLLENGEMEYLGRVDDQVKIRGYRIELGEIENALQQHTKIESAVVLAKTDEKGEKELVAYVVSTEQLNTTEVRDYLSRIIPSYMIPGHYVQLDQLPLTPNGKVDKKALPNPEGLGMQTGIKYVAPRNEIEERLVTIWQEVLGKKKIGIKDNFFELGGDSIKILRMAVELRKKLNLDIPITDIYKNNTIENILAHIYENKNEIDQKNKENKENERIVRDEIQSLKERILSYNNILNKENIEDIYPMSAIEKGMVYESLLNEGSGVYHDQMVHQKIFVGFEIERFRLALELLVEKHSILRTSFNLSDYEIEVQIVHKKVNVSILYKDISSIVKEEQEKLVQEYLKIELENSFNISIAPLWRMSVFSLGEDNFVFIWEFHHAIIDGWSNASFITELNNLYLKLEEEPFYTPPQLKSSYKNFIIQHELDKKNDTLKLFWKNELKGYVRLDLFTEEEEFKEYSYSLEKDCLDRLKNSAIDMNVTVKTISLSAYLYMLKIMNYDNEIVTGLVTNTRPNCEDSDKILGCFLNTFPLKMEVDATLNCFDFVKEVDNKLIELKEHERLSVFDISLIHNTQSKFGNPFFDVIFNYVDFHVYKSIDNEALTKGEKNVEINLFSRELTNMYLDFTINRTGGGFNMHFRIIKKLKSNLSPEKLSALYFNILNYIINNPQKQLKEIDYLSSAEKQKLVEEFNDTELSYLQEKTLVDLFEEQVEKTPKNIALVFEEKELSYKELNERSNQLADYLRKSYKIKADDLIGIKLERSELMIISILGVLKSGGAYVPIDPEYPQERIDYMVEDSKCKVLIDEGELAKFKKAEKDYSKKDLKRINTSNDLAYVIYTSGSTGKPKGCMLEHQGLINRIGWMWNHYGYDSSDIILQKTTYTFDVSVWELFMPLCWGAKMVLCHKEDIASPERILSLIEKQKVTCLHFVPSMLHAFITAIFEENKNIRSLNSLRSVITSGEALPVETVKQWYDKMEVPIHNLYGPTEASVDVTYYATKKGDTKIPIGRPISNTQIYIIDKADQLVSIGVAGEICIGGDGLARGYLNKPELTSEKFIKNPFKEGERMYKTGDLGRWLEDGNIEFIGRKDDQVKIRGYRIELGEIENALQWHESIESAVVLARTDDKGEKELVAYVVSKEELNTSELREYLKGKLPDYMVPGHYVQLEELPLTSNGKVDKKSLPDPEGLGMSTGVEYVAPRNKIEEKLVEIWSEVLGIERQGIGINDNFFELGGHSLKATRLVSRIYKELEVKLAIKELFSTVTLEGQASLIEKGGKIFYVGIQSVPVQSHYNLSSSQRRLWVLSQFEEGNVAYNMSGVYVFEGSLDKDSLERSFKTLIVRHEILRTVFKEDEQEEIKQFIKTIEESEFKIGYKDLRKENINEEQVKGLVQQEITRSFDLSEGPLVRAGLYQVEDTKWIFTYTMHHIISDGWSMGILIKELLSLYNAYIQNKENPLLPLRIQYKDYAVWQQEELSGENLKIHEDYWIKQFVGELPVLELATDKPRPAIKTYNGSIIHRRLGSKISKGIKDISHTQGGTLFMGLLSAVNTLLYRYTNQTDIIIGSPIAGREHTELEDQIGFYVNTLALRTQLKGEKSFIELFHHSKEITLGAYEHQVYPFDELIDKLSLHRDPSRNAMFDVMVVLQNTEIGIVGEQNLGDIKVSGYGSEQYVVSKFDLTFNFVEQGEGLYLGVEYNSDIYSKETIERLGDHLEGLLESIIKNPELSINKLEYLTKLEKQQLLEGFNNTAADYPKEKTIVDLFEAQVEKTPKNIALVFEETQLTYKELNERSNQLADYLRKSYNIKADDLIGIKLERSELMIISILGVLKSGGAYVPIDPDYPQERVDYMLEDSNCKVLIDDTELNKFKEEENKYSKKNPVSKNKASDLAYVIYTSGSTGKPKGVMIEHVSIVNLIICQCLKFKINDKENILQFSNMSFDASVEQIFIAFTRGARLSLIDKEVMLDSYKLEKFIDENKITHIHMIPSMLKMLSIKKYPYLYRVVSGGDKFPYELAKEWNKYHEFYNEYGPTETTVTSIELRYKKFDEIETTLPIGVPISNTQIFILGKTHQLQPIGVVGEICISGDGLARGYLNKPELTAEKFVDNPFRKDARMYKTGDLGRWLPDGNIEFIGRKDDQVKIRGYRIELGEIENALQEHSSIESAVVLAKTDEKGDKYLVGYVVSKEDLNASELRGYLKGKLPDYMVPGHYVQLEKLPLTPNGKVDKKALPNPEGLGMQTGVEYVAPRNEIETQLVKIYQEVLKKQPIGIKEDFFVLGGDSIKSIQIVSRLRQRGYLLSIRDILLYPKIENLTGHVQVVNRLIEQTSVEGLIPLSPIQHWFFENTLVDEHHYNQSVLLQSKASLSEEGLKQVLDKIVLHHDALRLVYKQSSTGWIQENKDKEQGFSLEIIEGADGVTLNAHCERIQSGMNLAQGPLFKVALFQGTQGDRLLLVAHHLIIDGVSWRILFEDLSNLYQQYQSGVSLHLPLKTDSFKYWQENQMAYANSIALRKEEAYWSGIESVRVEPLPIDTPAGSNLVKDAVTKSFLLDKETTDRLLTRCYRSYRTDTNDILLTAFSIALVEVFKSDKVLINLEGHGREQIGSEVDVSRTIGWFTTMYPIVFDMSYSKNSIRQLIEVKENLHRIPNKGIGYGVLRYLSGKEYQLSPEIVFNYLGDFGSGTETEGGKQLFEFSGEYHGREHSLNRQRDALLDVSGMVVDGKMRLSITYSDKQYSESTIERLLGYYQQKLVGLIEKLSQEERVHLSPVDLTYKGLSIDQLETLNTASDIEDVYPLNPLQEGIYYHWFTSPGSSVYFEQMSYRLKGVLDIIKLEESYALLINRHAVLRTSFTKDIGKGLLQVVRKSVSPAFSYTDISSENKHDKKEFSIEEYIGEYKVQDRAKGFDLHKGSQMRLTVLSLGDNRHEFIWSFHHILMDGWCVGVLIKEFFQIYHSLLQGQVPELGKVYGYSTYIKWLEQTDKEGSLKYWENYLSGYDTISTLPKLLKTVKQGYQHGEKVFSIEGSVREGIKRLCSELGVTENTFIQTVWGILLSKYNNTNDVIFGSVVSGRPAEVEGIEEMIGLFINTIPVRIQTTENTIITELLKEVQQGSIASTDHHYTQLAEIQSKSELGQGLLDHILVFENYPVQEMVKQSMKDKQRTNELAILSSEAFEQTNYDFTFLVMPGNNITFKYSYNENVYNNSQITQLGNHLIKIIEQVVEHPNSSLKEIDYLSSAEKHKLVEEFNNTKVDYPREKTIVDLFEEQVKKTPNNIALVFEETQLTYKELNAKSNQLADYLRKSYKIKADDLIGIKLERSELMIISILGVLKSGGAYVPIDPEYPQNRVDYMVEDSKCRLVIDQEELAKFKKEEKDFSKKNLKSINKPSDLAYVIYTSGSTGKPKGCMLEHQGVINRIDWMWRHYGYNSSDIILQKTTYTFDVSVWELFMPLCWGAKMVLCHKEDVASPERILFLIEKQKVTSLHFVPSMLHAFISTIFGEDKNIRSLNSLRSVITSGEALPVETVKQWYDKMEVSIHNLYGPTESSVDVTYYATKKGETNIPIGRPISNTQLYILGKENELLPIGVIGEICIGGDGLARGYLNQPELTAKKFVDNPFKECERLYKTGDLGRWLPDGNIEFIGRKDDQVKIRGYRIELGEIENALQRHESITSAVVLAKTDDKGEKDLVAYVVSTKELNASDLRDYLSRVIPSYMVPGHYVQLEKLPLTPNGKVDKKALSSPDGLGMKTGVEYVAPRNEIEEKLIKIWQEVLGKEKVGIKDNFFELGGHSLKAMRLITAVKNDFGLNLDISNFFHNPTIEDIAIAVNFHCKQQQIKLNSEKLKEIEL